MIVFTTRFGCGCIDGGGGMIDLINVRGVDEMDLKVKRTQPSNDAHQ